MVAALITVNAMDRKVERNPLFVVELVGLAGSGKTTLSQALSQRQEKVLVGAELELRKLDHIPVFLGNVSALLPMYLQRYRTGRWFTWDELKSMAYLREWPRFLRQQAGFQDTMILLDHGPVFKLATLDAFGPKRLSGPGFRHWWNEIIGQWAKFLDLIIWLEAPDAVLIQRINRRSQKHIVKGKSEPEASKFLARYRGSYEQILGRLSTDGGPTVLQFDTSRMAIEQIVDDVVTACEARRHESLQSANTNISAVDF